MISYKTAKKVVVAVVGGTVLLVGIAMIVLPGPAFLVIPAGLAILATEFAWAHRWLQKAKEKVEEIKNKKANGKSKAPGPPA